MVAKCSAVRLGSMGQHRSLMIDYNTYCKVQTGIENKLIVY